MPLNDLMRPAIMVHDDFTLVLSKFSHQNMGLRKQYQLIPAKVTTLTHTSTCDQLLSTRLKNKIKIN
jgi:hypothetical protein